MTAISIITSMYRTEQHLPNWSKQVLSFAEEARKIGLDFEINAIANEPSEIELEHLNKLALYPWFHIHSVPRESIYASWNRGVRVSTAKVCTFWNVDDIRNAKAIADGLNQIANSSSTEETSAVVYFPFIYKRYINFLNHNFLVKRTTVRPPIFSKAKFIQSMHMGPFFMFTKSAYGRIGGFDEKYTIVGDYEWQARAAANGVQFLKSDTIAGIFTNNGKTLSGSRAAKHTGELQSVYDKFNVAKTAV
ncbi:hypothetical protein A3I99_02040 [Candidatus Kaiserbacteria bacterium RIFCSPLOWO2_02_FULL_45_11b]|uniref:Glycosyltransferase 2-like domain-containing protein n=1 Tax=Candidatus Kaiserbacteria bacterium RIFCSPLOWO2_12_FULL_45_26 TaxID=1798525 RepID=A0A1F6FHK2_9BACT|nr:MAG: hypothetical protein A2Z56_04825 [Candidatus Kaiserbacteria bacterium RIFCSPHIGHO2_12_45_16]OGG70176.1 MAG: hypothetical protein A2929_03780 [Candidatus Kaiserbacteria bacterium RIFCSPLOWO2_01_FULL_45_25]OGG81845.1 MAG: hypothetical protein A3I99_02040 [Candidatus Kaiserbacteria bacterium RIFCSPLOWO2_02_FULL_45_11b]OGG85347.1 MAG: hypothetical protein A3G90_04840 [Candidatus Kaiserbacteria bacterium RIFCSPLOWO2_12_FULL_45_26]